MILVISPAAIVTPPDLNVILPNSLHSLYNSNAIGRDVLISIEALELFPKHLGRLFTISPVLLCNWAKILLIIAGSTRD